MHTFDFIWAKIFFIRSAIWPFHFERLGYLILICMLAVHSLAMHSFLRNVFMWEVTHFCFQSMSFIYMKANKSHPMHRTVIFRMKGKCTLLKSALSWKVLDSNFETWSSILNHQDSRLNPRKFWESSLETRVTVNLRLSRTVSLSSYLSIYLFSANLSYCKNLRLPYGSCATFFVITTLRLHFIFDLLLNKRMARWNLFF